MNTRTFTTTLRTLARTLLLTAAVCCVLVPGALAQTAGGTSIQNRASASYSDGTNTYTTISNTVTVVVSNVAGLVITPDGGTNPTVVPGVTGQLFNFTVSNTGNFANTVRFLASGGSILVSGPGTMTRAVVDNGTTPNTIDAGDTNILGGSNVDQAVAAGANFRVLVEVSVNAGALPAQTITVTLGDSQSAPGAVAPGYDDVPVGTAGNPFSARDVRTSSATVAVNGFREAQGTISATVQNDAQLQVKLSAPAGPIALGADIAYTTQLCNVGNRDATAVTLGGQSGVFIVAPIPVGTVLKSGQTFAGSLQTLYSTDALTTTSPLGPPPVTLQPAATWSTTAPADLTTVRRIAFKVGNSLVAATCGATIPFTVTVTTTDATTPIKEMVDGFADNTVGTRITDQSDGQSVGAQITGQGDGNALGINPQPNPGVSGTPILTPLQQSGAVLLGPSGQPGAVGPTDNNDDYTNKTVAAAAIVGVAPGGVTVAASTVDFVNTVRNSGNANDTFTLTAPTVPAGFTVQISTDGGTTFVTVSGGGSTTLAINFNSQANITVRVTAPTAQAILTGFATVIRARSANTNTSTNDTIDRLYTGFLSLSKSFTIINGTGVGAATDPVPGAAIEYNIAYSNISSSGGSNNVTLTASNVVISEDGAAAPNNWAANTTQVIAPAPSDVNTTGTAGTITDGTTSGAVTATTTFLKDTVTSLPAGASGNFKFRRRIN